MIVACNYDDAREMVQTRFPEMRLLSLPNNTTVPQLRTQGILESKGEVVALLEDHCFVAKDWCVEIKKAHALSYSAVGGSVENASTERAIDWAVYFYDYGKYMQPNKAATMDSLSGNNVSYKKSVLAQIEKTFRKGFFEAFVHLELRKRGYDLYLLPSAVVYHNKSYEMSGAFNDCYHHGRLFAGMRASSMTRLKRSGLALGSSVLPFLLSARIVLRVVRKKRHVKELLLSLPQILLLMTGWSVGEFCGYAFGQGASAEKWK